MPKHTARIIIFANRSLANAVLLHFLKMPLTKIMKAATIHSIKQELNNSSNAMLVDLCLRLAKYKKENKELLSYLLFEAHDEPGYIKSVKEEIDSEFASLTKANAYLVKKSLRRILRETNKYIKYTASKQAEAELLIHYCKCLKDSKVVMAEGSALLNLYMQQLKKVNAALLTLHEDIQHDYKKDIAYISTIEIKHARKKWF
jgi:hypothetical protein